MSRIYDTVGRAVIILSLVGAAIVMISKYVNVTWDVTFTGEFDILETILVVATAVIAAFSVLQVILVYIHQDFERKVHRVNFKKDLFEDRLSIYKELVEYFGEYQKHGKPDLQKSIDLSRNMLWATFLFEEKQIQYIKTIRKKAVDYNYHEGQANFYRQKLDTSGSLSMQEDQKLRDHVKQTSKIVWWFHEQFDKGIPKKIFDDLLDMPADL